MSHRKFNNYIYVAISKILIYLSRQKKAKFHKTILLKYKLENLQIAGESFPDQGPSDNAIFSWCQYPLNLSKCTGQNALPIVPALLCRACPAFYCLPCLLCLHCVLRLPVVSVVMSACRACLLPACLCLSVCQYFYTYMYVRCTVL
jgi:hypothetical protein